MGVLHFLRGRTTRRRPARGHRPSARRWRKAPSLCLERLEARDVPATTGVMAGGILQITGGPGDDRIELTRGSATGQLVLRDAGRIMERFDLAGVAGIQIATGDGDDVIKVAAKFTMAATLDGGAGDDVIVAGGGAATLIGGEGADKITGGAANDQFFATLAEDQLFSGGGDDVSVDPTTGSLSAVNSLCNVVLTDAEVGQLLDRASAATPSTDGIMAIVDRNGRILGVRVEAGVSPAITGDVGLLVFAIDGAVAKARTGAFFANNQAPLTSRTVQFISQTTMTEREINSNPNITDPDSTLRGPGFVAPIGVNSHFPPDVLFTPQVDLFAIEHTNRDSIVHPGLDHIKGTADDQLLLGRFDIDPAFVPAGKDLPPPESYGLASGRMPAAQARGIATLPGGIPIYKNGCLVGGIGVFFPGDTGFATEENSVLDDFGHDPSRLDRSTEAEYIAFATVNGAPLIGLAIGPLGGVPPVPGVLFPLTNENKRIDLVGITLDIVGPGGLQGPQTILAIGRALGAGAVNGANQPLRNPGPDGIVGTDLEGDPFGADDVADADGLLPGLVAPEGFLVTPHDSPTGDLTAADVRRIITQGIAEANRVRAAIRLPLGSRTRMVLGVTDENGEVLGLFRMPDATVFSIDVAVAKARNVAYYGDPTALQDIDRIAGLPTGVAFTNRTFRYVALPRFPEGIDGADPGPFSILNDGGASRINGRQIGPALPASAFTSVQGFDAFNPGTNFRDTGDIRHQNGIVFFPGSEPLYKRGGPGAALEIYGGFGVSGDGVDQDDTVTFAGSKGFKPPLSVLRADEVFVRGIRLPYQKFLRNPRG